MADFDDDGYERMVCIEAGYVSKPYSLNSKQSVTMSQTISVDWLNKVTNNGNENYKSFYKIFIKQFDV